MALLVKIPFAGLFRGFFRQAGKSQAAPVPGAAAPVAAKKYSPAPASAISFSVAGKLLMPCIAVAEEIAEAGAAAAGTGTA